MKTAEWTCTSCGATNRKLVVDTATRATDRCVTCHRRHVIQQGERPVRWQATADR